MKISVVMPVLNGSKFIRSSIESVLSQKGLFELELIVRDGGSTDGTLEILKSYGDRLKFVSQRDGSPQEAINAGLASAAGDIGAWLNADDLYEPGALARVAEAFEADASCRWLYGRCRIVDADGREMRKAVTQYKNVIGWIPSRDVLLCENFISQPATFWRMDLWREAGGLSSSFKAAWDYELWLRMSAIACPKALHEPLACFRRHPGSISESFTERQFKEELKIAKDRGTALHYVAHVFNCWKIVYSYKLLNFLGK